MTIQRTGRVLVLCAFVASIFLLLAPSMLACPVCYGETDSTTADGINSAILLMVGVTGGVVGGIVAFFVNLSRRALHQGDQGTRIHEMN